MSAARTARRRRKQATQGFTHLDKMKRPHYRRKQLLNVADAIAMERRRAAAEQKRKANKK